MRNLRSWLLEYGSSHADPRNRLLHQYCIPTTVLALVCALRLVPLGDALWNPASVALLLWLAFYASLSWQLSLGMLIVFALLYSAALLLESAFGAWTPGFAALMFLGACAGQYLGHHAESRHPSLRQHLRLFLIAPLWQLADLYRRMQIPVGSGGLAQSR